MADEDNYDDLNELETDTDELTETFTRAANHLQTIVDKVDKGTLLSLYGYYKQATEGPCNTPKPGWFDMKAKSKWDAWSSLGNMPENEAKKLYINKIGEFSPEFAIFKESSASKGWASVSTLMGDSTGEKKSKTLADFVTEGNVEMVESILKSMDAETVQGIVNELDDEGLGLIHWAADRGSAEILQLLVSYKADVNLEDSEKQTALHYAASCGHYDCAEFIMQNGVDVHKKDVNGLDAASVASDERIKMLLLNFGKESSE